MISRLIRCVVASVGLTLAAAQPAHAQSCSADINGDGVVDGVDLATVLAQWGTCPPRITQVTPLQGIFSGRTLITITGSGLATVVEVSVGGNPCTDVTVLSPTSVTAMTPPGALGEAPIKLTSSVGSTLSPTPFTYVWQEVAAVVPSSGSYAGGTSITISGQFLAGTTSVTVGGVPCTNVVALSANEVTATTPPGSVGPVDVALSGPKGTIVVPGGFTYLGVTVPSWATLLEAAPDPAIVHDPALRAAITATSLAWRVRDTATQIEFVLIPPGTYQRGCSQSPQYGCNGDESPVHQVTLTQPMYMGRYEVTQAQWQARMGSNPSSFQSASAQVPANQVPNRPVEQVSWNMIQGFLSATGMRLPTEAEWEWAYRAGTTTAFHSMPGHPNGTNDDSLVGNIAWWGACCGGNSNGETRPVGGKAGNGFGLHDMSGNVYEWVHDWYGTYPSAPQVDPVGPASGSSRVIRGGSWDYVTFFVRSSYRLNLTPGISLNDVGFRVARTP